MKRLAILLLSALPMPALAQHDGHVDHSDHTAPEAPVDPHQGHAAPEEPPADPHEAHAAPQKPPSDPHAGHAAPADAAPDPHAGHDMPPPALPAPPASPAPTEAASGPTHAADTFWNRQAMARARAGMRTEHGGMETQQLLIDRLEARIHDGGDGYAWDAQGWYGGDIDKVWLKSEGEGAFGGPLEQAEVQALWSHAVDPFFDLQLGARYDLRPDPGTFYMVAGFQGLAPYWFEVEGALFLSQRGDLSARFEAEYDLRITQKLILQPRGEIALALQDVPELETGSGLTGAEIGARLRYELRPEFAPYIGVEYQRAFGGTARYRRQAGEEAGGWSLLLGLSARF